ncbi:MAG: DUF3419 family protein [Candidatus Dojkabacteria bacterium]|nr:DUF3419 family protein [Candidatus Dojkabacteria bacterium]MDQ7020905.1 DUF3419 family protein [Candidatus Dojkabacteria bacterium]
MPNLNDIKDIEPNIVDQILDDSRNVSDCRENVGYKNSFYAAGSDSTAIVKASIEAKVASNETGLPIKVAMVASSGDSILEAIAEGVSEIDAFDVSQLALEYMNLKIAAVKYLEYEQYVEIFDLSQKLKADNSIEILNDIDLQVLQPILINNGLSETYRLFSTLVEEGHLISTSNQEVKNTITTVRTKHKESRSTNIPTSPDFVDNSEDFYKAKSQLVNRNVKVNSRLISVDSFYVNEQDQAEYDFIFISNIGINSAATIEVAQKILLSGITDCVIFTTGFTYLGRDEINPSNTVLRYYGTDMYFIDDYLIEEGRSTKIKVYRGVFDSKNFSPSYLVITCNGFDSSVFGGENVFTARLLGEPESIKLNEGIQS